jgi:signal transduction histidine kinase
MTNSLSIQKELQYRLDFEKLITSISTHFINLESDNFYLGIHQGMERLSNFAGFQRICIYILDPEIPESVFEWNQLDFPTHKNFTKEQLPTMFPWIIQKLSNNEVINFVSPKRFPETACDEFDLFLSEQITSFILLPMINQSKFSGWMELVNFSQSKDWNQNTQELFRNIANIFMNALERKKTEDKIHQLYLSLEQKINEKTNELSTLLNIQKALTTELHIDHVIQLIADEARRLTNTRIGTLYLVENGKLRLKVISGDLDVSLPIGFEIPIEGSIAGIVLKTGSPILVEDTTTAAGIFQEAIRLTNSKSILIMPLTSGRETIGVLSVSDKESGVLGKEEERLLKMFANIAIIALDNARLYKEEQDRREEAERGRRVAEALRDILRILNSKLDLPEVLQYIANQSKELLNASSTMIRKINYESQTVITEASANLPEEFDVIKEIPFYPGGSERILRDNKPVVVSNLRDSLGRYLNDPQELSSPQQAWARVILKFYCSHLITPLIVNDSLYGTLTFYYNRTMEFSEEDIYLGLTLATQVSLAIENARLRDQEKEIAIATERNRLARDLHDAVTQTLFSATLIAEVLPRLWDRNPIEARKRLEELRQLTRGALAEMRTLLLELRPSALQDASFAELLKQLCEALNGRTRIPVELSIECEPDFPPDIKIAFYRITQEALNNIAKHADATLVIVRLWNPDDNLNLLIQDNGKGIQMVNVPSNHLGIGIMKERSSALGAEFIIDSTPGIGTKILLQWNTSIIRK